MLWEGSYFGTTLEAILKVLTEVTFVTGVKSEEVNQERNGISEAENSTGWRKRPQCLITSEVRAAGRMFLTEYAAILKSKGEASSACAWSETALNDLVCSFAALYRMPPINTPHFLSILCFKDVWVVSSLGLLRRMLPWIFLSESLGAHVRAFPWAQAYKSNCRLVRFLRLRLYQAMPKGFPKQSLQGTPY